MRQRGEKLVFAAIGVEQGLFGEFERRHIAKAEKEQLRIVETPGVQQHHTLADLLEAMDHFEIVHDAVLRADVLEQGPQQRNIPLPVAQLVDETSDSVFGRHAKTRVERAIRRMDSQAGRQDHERLVDRVDDSFRVFLRVGDLAGGTLLRRDVKQRDDDAADPILR